MNPRWRIWLEGLLAFALPVFPTIAAVVIAFGSLIARPPSRSRRLLLWTMVWGGYLGWLLIPSIIAGHALALPVLNAILGLVLATAVTVRRPRATSTGLVLALTLFVGLAVTQQALSLRLWIDNTVGNSLVDALHGISRFSGDASGWTRNGIRMSDRSWQLPEDVESLVLSFDARGNAAPLGWQWYTNDGSTRQERLEQDGLEFTRISDREARVVRRVRMGTPLAGRQIRITIQMRTSEPVEAEGCRGVQVRTLEPWLPHCHALSLGTEWSYVEIDHSFAEDATGDVFDLAIGANGAGHTDVADVRVEIGEGDTWQAASHMEPTGFLVRVVLPGREDFQRPTITAIPSTEWTSYRLEFSLDTERPDELGVHMQLEQGTTVELRNITLLRADGGSRQPTSSTIIRSTLWFEDPNLAGHSLLVAGLLATWVAPASALGVASAVMTLLATAATGSRAASVAAILLLVTYLMRHRPIGSRESSRLFRRLGLVALLLIAATSLASLLANRTDNANEVPRIEIWHRAIEFSLELPLTGIGPDGFASAWQQTNPGDLRRIPTHAHNFWLQHSAAYGVFGLIASIWLTVGIGLMAFRTAGPQGLTLLLPVFLLQVFDHTLFFVGVLGPLMFLAGTMSDRSLTVRKRST